ncbi:MAG: class I SAM-dependent methyltransferase [Deltaproteobacteria bacterium]|nr:class I SAM-dependent methyltransferase [Deltaproteobacteria bacterium]
MRDCINCDGPLRCLINDIEDYEYGVPWRSDLVICDGCGLVTHDPPITYEDIGELYPDTYHAYGGGSKGRGLYWKLRKALASFTLRKVLPRIPQGGAMLEVGCGNGSFLRLVAEARPDIELHGVDIVDTGIEGIPNFTFHQGQLEKVELPGRQMDLVYFSNLIEHVPDPVVFLRKCGDLLRPGGCVYGNTPDHLSVDRYLFGKHWAGYHYPRHTFLFSHENMGQILQKAGLVDPTLKGSYAFWSLSLRNMLMELPGTKKRGLGHAAITLGMLPLDLLINVFRGHGAMTFSAVKP